MIWTTLFSVLLLFTLLLLLAFCLIFHKRNGWLKKENRLLRRHQEFYQDHYRLMEHNIQVVRKLRHDITNHLQIIERLAAQTSSQSLIQYHQALSDKSQSLERMDYSSNPIIDAVLYNKIEKCKSEGIPFHIQFSHFDIPVSMETDLVKILFNILDNAIESCLRAGEERSPCIILKGRKQAGRLILSLTNTRPVTQPEGLRTTKEDSVNHGYGLLIVEETVKKYDGSVLYEEEDHLFRTLISMIPDKDGELYDK